MPRNPQSSDLHPLLVSQARFDAKVLFGDECLSVVARDIFVDVKIPRWTDEAIAKAKAYNEKVPRGGIRIFLSFEEPYGGPGGDPFNPHIWPPSSEVPEFAEFERRRPRIEARSSPTGLKSSTSEVAE